MTRYVDAETGKAIVPIAVDLETGARIGTRSITAIDSPSRVQRTDHTDTHEQAGLGTADR